MAGKSATGGPTLQGRIVIIHYGLKQLRNVLGGLSAVEQLLRVHYKPDDADEAPDLSHVDRLNLCQLLALVGDSVGDALDSLTEIAAAAEQEAMQ